MSNGKVKHVLRSDSSMEHERTRHHPFRPRASTVSYPLTSGDQPTSFNYANIEFPSEGNKVEVKVTDDGTALNYANIEFAETLPLYENSNLVLSRMEPDKMEAPCQSKPPLPPRALLNASKVNKVMSSSDSKESVDDKCQCKQPPINRSPKKTPVNGSAYEMMCYEKNAGYSQNDEDYLLMQPLCLQDDNASQVVKCETSSVPLDAEKDVATKQLEVGDQSVLPLRPFMPYSYPVADNINSSLPEGISGSDSLMRKHQLIHEDLQIRALRSNSLSELKKKVLMRKRSSSVDGKNNGYLSKDSGTESVPASPISSPRPSAQRKNSLFSKLNLRSKEKSMSTNEITLPLPVPNENSSLSKSGLHRSADCLKLSEEFANSEEDLNSDSSDFAKDSCHNSPMKRSRSVPCRAAMPTVSVSSPVRTSETIMELNDLNKEAAVLRVLPESAEEPVQRKYSLDSHERSKQRVAQKAGSNCDNVYRQECLDESDTVMEMQGVLRRNHLPAAERGHVAENYRSNTSSCSSSDISDYMESLSFISRSSSSSSGSTSSADYMRSEEIYLLKAVPRPPPKQPCIAIPALHHQVDTKHRSFNDSSSLDTSSSGSSQDSEDMYLLKTTVPRPPPKGVQQSGCIKHFNEVPSLDTGGSRPDTRACASIRCGSNRESRSSTSSTSSLSTSPGVTDYSSSTSSSSPPCQSALVPHKQMFGKRKPPDVPGANCSCSEKGSSKTS